MRRVSRFRRRAACRRRASSLPTGGGLGYGGFVLDPATRAYLLTHLPDIPDALTRGSALVTLWEDMLDGRPRPADVVDVLVRACRASATS